MNRYILLDMLSVQNRKRKRLYNKISQNETGEDTNYDIVVKKSKQKVVKSKGMTSSQKNALRKGKKKLEKLREKKVEKEEREKVLTSLSKHAISSEQLTLFHSSSGRRPNAQLAIEHEKRCAVIVNHKKKKKKCNSVLKMLDPVEEKPTAVTDSSSESEEEDVVEMETDEEDALQEDEPPIPEKPKKLVEKKFTGEVAEVKERAPRKPAHFIRFKYKTGVLVPRLTDAICAFIKLDLSSGNTVADIYLYISCSNNL